MGYTKINNYMDGKAERFTGNMMPIPIPLKFSKMT